MVSSEKIKKTQILTVLVGSRAHGTATESSDRDVRGVYIEPTSQLISLGYKSKGVFWVEGETEDQTSYELGYFLKLALQGHPNILEMFVAPIIEATEDGKELLELFPYIWSAQSAYESFMNYCLNRKKHMITVDDKKVALKSGYGYIRVLFNLLTLLREKTFSIKLDAGYPKCCLEDIKNGFHTYGQILDYGEDFEKFCKAELPKCNQIQDYNKVHNFYIKMRKKYW